MAVEYIAILLLSTFLDIPKGTDETESIFSANAMKHIFHGEINKKGKAVGYHHESMMGGKIIEGTRSIPNSQGVYSANVAVNGVNKQVPSTFFPQEMNRVDVLNSIKEAFGNKVQIRGNKYTGTTSSGMQVEMYLDQGNKVITAYPKY